MKKYILTESQIKNVIKSTITEQRVDTNYKKTIQCFLNKIMKTNINVDGIHGDDTKKLIEKYQTARKVYPTDGIWGSETNEKLSEYDIKIIKECANQYTDIIDKILMAFGLFKPY